MIIKNVVSLCILVLYIPFASAQQEQEPTAPDCGPQGGIGGNVTGSGSGSLAGATMSGSSVVTKLKEKRKRKAQRRRSLWKQAPTSLIVLNEQSEEKRRGHQNSRNTTITTRLIGTEKRLTRSLLVGVMLGKEDVDNRFINVNRQKSAVDAKKFYTHLAFERNELFLDILLGYQSANENGSRQTFLIREDGSETNTETFAYETESELWSFQLMSGITFNNRGLRLTPHLQLQMERGDRDGYDENPGQRCGTNKRFSKSSIKSTRSVIGVTADYVVRQRWGIWIPSVTISHDREHNENGRVRVASHSDSEFDSNRFGSPSVLEREPRDLNYFKIRTGISAQFQQGIAAFVAVESLFADSFRDRTSAVIGIRYEW